MRTVLAVLVTLVIVTAGATGLAADKAVVGIKQCDVFATEELTEKIVTLDAGTEVSVVKQKKATVQVTTQDGKQGWVRLCYLSSPTEYIRRKKDIEVPLRVLCIGAEKGGRTFFYGGTMPIINGNFALEAGQGFWMDESAKGQKFTVASHSIRGDPKVVFLYKADNSIAKLSIWQANLLNNEHITSQAAPSVEPTVHAAPPMGKKAERQAAVEREKPQKAKNPAMGKWPLAPTANEIKRDGRFIAYDNGTILDTSTKLVWAAKDNGSDINWANAKIYCDNYRGGGYTDWRMPTQDELAGLYDASSTGYALDCGSQYGRVKLTNLISLTCVCPWASETRGSDAAYFSFNYGLRYWYPQSYVGLGRALPVRSGKWNVSATGSVQKPETRKDAPSLPITPGGSKESNIASRPTTSGRANTHTHVSAPAPVSQIAEKNRSPAPPSDKVVSSFVPIGQKWSKSQTINKYKLFVEQHPSDSVYNLVLGSLYVQDELYHHGLEYLVKGKELWDKESNIRKESEELQGETKVLESGIMNLIKMLNAGLKKNIYSYKGNANADTVIQVTQVINKLNLGFLERITKDKLIKREDTAISSSDHNNIAKYQTIVKQNPNSAIDNIILGLLYVQRKSYTEGTPYLDKGQTLLKSGTDTGRENKDLKLFFSIFYPIFDLKRNMVKMGMMSWKEGEDDIQVMVKGVLKKEEERIGEKLVVE